MHGCWKSKMMMDIVYISCLWRSKNGMGMITSTLVCALKYTNYNIFRQSSDTNAPQLIDYDFTQLASPAFWTASYRYMAVSLLKCGHAFQNTLKHVTVSFWCIYILQLSGCHKMFRFLYSHHFAQEGCMVFTHSIYE